MKAYRQADMVQGVSILSATEFADIATANRSSSVLYVIGTLSDATATTERRTITISDVYIGNTPQQFLVDNTDTLVWGAASGSPTAAVAIENLV